MRIRYIAIACAALMAATPAYSDDITGSELYRRCETPRGSSEYTWCTGYAMGFLSRYREVCKLEKEPAMEAPQARSIVEKYLRDHPGQLNENAGVIVGRAFHEVLGCPKKDWKNRI